MNRFIQIMTIAALPACTSMEEHDAKPYAVTFEVQQSYQTVYARTLHTMRRCLNPGRGYLFSPVTEQMDAQLYPDLGFGELTRYQANVSAIPWSTTRIARQGNGAVVSIKTSSQAEYAQRQTLAWLSYWAKGGTTCPKLFEPPPPL